MRMTFANLSSSGKIPSWKDRFMINVSGLMYRLMTCLANSDGIPSQPGLLLLSELIVFITSIYSMCRIVIPLGLFCRKSSGLRLVVTWMAANVGPIDTK